jgi:hypothetical protein
MAAQGITAFAPFQTSLSLTGPIRVVPIPAMQRDKFRAKRKDRVVLRYFENFLLQVNGCLVALAIEHGPVYIK